MLSREADNQGHSTYSGVPVDPPRYRYSLNAYAVSLQGWGLIDLPLRALREHRRSSGLIPSTASGARNLQRGHSTRHSQRPETFPQKMLDGVAGRELVCVAQVTLAGERQVGISPLVLALQTPRFFDVDRSEPHAVEPPIDQMRQSRAGVFHQLSIGLACRDRWIVAPACDPIPFSRRISIVELYLLNRSSGTDLFEPCKHTCVAILI